MISRRTRTQRVRRRARADRDRVSARGGGGVGHHVEGGRTFAVPVIEGTNGPAVGPQVVNLRQHGLIF